MAIGMEKVDESESKLADISKLVEELRTKIESKEKRIMALESMIAHVHNTVFEPESCKPQT